MVSRVKSDLGCPLIEGAPDSWADSDGLEEGFEDGIVDIDGGALGCVDSEGCADHANKLVKVYLFIT